jgi:hypothetical protein
MDLIQRPLERFLSHEREEEQADEDEKEGAYILWYLWRIVRLVIQIVPDGGMCSTLSWVWIFLRQYLCCNVPKKSLAQKAKHPYNTARNTILYAGVAKW